MWVSGSDVIVAGRAGLVLPVVGDAQKVVLFLLTERAGGRGEGRGDL